MKDLTHYFADSFTSSETPPENSEEVSVKSGKVIEVKAKSTKINSATKKRGRKKSKAISPDVSNLKKSKSELTIEKSTPLTNGTKDLLKNVVSKDTPEKCGPRDFLKTFPEENSIKRFSGESDLKKSNLSQSQESRDELSDVLSKNMNDGCDVEENEKEDRNSDDGSVDIYTSDPACEEMVSETVLATQNDKKNKYKKKIKALAEKKGYAKRKLREDEEAEEMKKKLQERKNVFANVPQKNGSQVEVIHKPPAYSLLNYFSKATPEQKQKEEAAKCKISVKAVVHTPKEGVTPISTPDLGPKSHCLRALQSKKKRSEIKNELSNMDEIQFVSSESLSPPNVLQEKKKPNKPKWRIQFHSDSFTDCGSDSETFLPKSPSKMQKENRESEEVWSGKEKTLIGKENPKRADNSDSETSKQTRKDRSARNKSKIIKRLKSDIVESSTRRDKEENETSADKTKLIDFELDNEQESLDNDISIVGENMPKRLAPEKIAPLFIKKRKLDPAFLEARKLFMQSEMSENDKRPVKRKPSPVRNPSLPFPRISHVTQLNSDSNSESEEIKLKLKSPCKYMPSLDVSKFKNMTGINDSTAKRWMTTLEPVGSKVDIEEALNEIESRCSDARALWNAISQSPKPESPKQLPKGRTSKRKAAIKKIVDTDEVKSIDDHDSVWICKYKPMSTQEIVGNEQAAAKLKTWLDKWKLPVVTDNGSSGDEFYSSDCSSNYSSNGYNQVAILLGPHGCGKTASVYAVAQELGYSVLEVNASSRRTGKRIFKELEEATKSHRIKKSDMKQTLLKTKIEEKRVPQNSLILMEDVDIIFEEDEGFISAAFQLASNTKRPIVMTCNETCSHLSKLAPQQFHIQFQAIAGHRAVALLELISLAETGQKLSISCVKNLLECGDLRKALLQLQYLLAAGQTHVLSPILDAEHRFGVSLWRKTRQFLYKPAMKDSKKRKKKTSSPKDTDAQEVDALTRLADDLESVSLISKLIDINDLSWNSPNSKSVLNLSLSEDMRPYSYSKTISSDIAEWMIYEVIQKKESKNSVQNFDQTISKLLMKRTVNVGINSVLSQIASSTTDQRQVSEDYLPCIRAICRAEETRNSSNNKRGNRFFHYLHGTKLPTNSTNILSAACKIMQEKPEKD